MINDKTYKEVLKGYSLVEISGDGCAACHSLLPVLQDISKSMNLNLFFANASSDVEEMLKHYDVTAIPTILLLHDSLLLGKVKGFQPQEILEIWIETKINDHIKGN